MTRSTPGTFTPEKRTEAIRLHGLGLSHVAIAKEIGLSDSLMSRFFKSQGLLSNGRRGPEIVEDGMAKCRSCESVKPLSEWSTGRNTGKPRHYRSVCKECWNASIYAKRNSTLESAPKYKLITFKNRCRREQIYCDISIELMVSLWEAQKGLCFYSDMPLIVEAGTGRKPNSMSIDRVDAKGVYVAGNVVLAADRINTMKQDATLEEMRMWMPEWHRRAVAFLEGSHK